MLTILQVVLSAFVHLAMAAGEDCTKASFSPRDCCNFPQIPILHSDEFRKLVTKIAGDKPVDGYLSECNLAQGLFKEYEFLKDGEINAEGIANFYETNVVDAEWKPILKAAAKVCKTKINAKADKIFRRMESPPFGFSKNQCNAKPSSFTVCIFVEIFNNCPQSKWTDDASCNAGKSWLTECGDKIDSVKEMGAIFAAGSPQ